jgi:alkylated DNA nucleotide flippase Atl1
MKKLSPANTPTAAEIGKLGGQSKSKRKIAAILENLAKARQKRWPKKVVANRKRLA